MGVDYAIRRRYAAIKRFADKILKAKYMDPVAIIFMVMVFSAMQINYLADRNAKMVKNGNFDRYEVKLPDLESGKQIMAVLGSSNRFVYFYDPQTKTAYVVPIESVGFMRKLS